MRTSLDDNKWALNRDVEPLSKYLQFRNAIFLWNFSAIDEKKHHYNFEHPDNEGQVSFFAMELLSILWKNMINSQRLPFPALYTRIIAAWETLTGTLPQT